MKSLRVAMTALAMVAVASWAMGAEVPTYFISGNLSADVAQAAPASGCGQCLDTCDCCDPCWTVTADALYMNRISHKDLVIVRDDSVAGVPLISVNDFDFDFEIGPRIGLIRHGDNGWDLEAVYFGVDAWHEAIAALDADGEVFDTPQYMVSVLGLPTIVDYRSRLYNAEFNLIRVPECGWIKPLAGFRYMELLERMDVGTPGIGGEFWTTTAANHLTGFQIGADVIMLDRGGRLRVNGLVKVGVYYNDAEQTSVAHIFPFPDEVARDEDDHTAMVGEVAVIGVYQLTDAVALRGGYQFMWIDGVALASNQFPVSNVISGTAAVDTAATALYHGLLFGLQVDF